MSDKTRDITLGRINRLTQTVADMGENNTAQGRMLLRMLSQINDQLVGVRAELTEVKNAVRELASEQVLLGKRFLAGTPHKYSS